MKALLVGLAMFSLCIQSAAAQSGADDAPTHEQVSQVKEFLFVQNASSGTFKDSRLTLDNSGPILFFSDRPYRVFGHTRAQHFVDAWGTGTDSFADVPPNGVLSILGDDVQSIGIVLSEPKFEDGAISYAVVVKEGTLPSKFGNASLFIDNEAWAAVGGLVVGRHMARRRDAEQVAAYGAGQASMVQDQNTYYQAQQAPPPTTSSATPTQQLSQLKDMLDQGLISQSDYDKKKQQILQQM